MSVAKTKQGMPKAPKQSFDQAVKEMDIDPAEVEGMVDRVTQSIVEDEFGAKDIPGDSHTELEEQVAYDGTAPDPNAIPAWVKLPDDAPLPSVPDICFMRFRAKWTRTPSLGDRVVVLWPLSWEEEKLATRRAGGDSVFIPTYQALQCIRFIDGMKADWTGRSRPGVSYEVMKFNNEIGKKCRHMIENYYARVHMLDNEELSDFFVNGFALRTGVVG